MPDKEVVMPYFQSSGIRFSTVPRDRYFERISNPTGDTSLFGHLLDNGARTQFYVTSLNRDGMTPHASIRDPRQTFYDQKTLVHTMPLSQDEDGAELNVISAVTGPYVARSNGFDEWHGMILVDRGGLPIPTFGELSRAECVKLHQVIGRTLDFLQKRTQKQDGLGIVGFSFSPLESHRRAVILHPESHQAVEILFPRSPVQNMATIHGHVVHINPDSLLDKPTMSSEGDFDKRMVYEPKLDRLVEIFDRLVLGPTQREFPSLHLTKFDNTSKDGGYPKGIMLMAAQEDLKGASLPLFIQGLHKRAELVYGQLAHCLTYEDELAQGIVRMKPKHEVRHNLLALLARQEYGFLSDKTRLFIRSLERLKDPNRLISVNMPVGELARAVESFVLLGLSYNIVYYYPQKYPGQAVIAVEPRWFSGACPLETVGIFKDQYEMPHEEFAAIMDAHKRIGLDLVEFLNHT